MRRRKTNRQKLIENATSLEKTFMKILRNMNIDYVFQYPLENKIYDFYIPSKHMIIEVDGDFYHCNPAKFKPKYKTQRINIKNDVVKNKLCAKHGIPLLRFWETEINENLNSVIQRLMSEILLS